MGTAAPTAPWEVLWTICQQTCFWQRFYLLHQSALRPTHTCLATTALATPATVLAMAASATLVMPAMDDLATPVTLPPMLPATPVSLPPPLSPPWELPLPPSLLSEELMPVLDVTSPTLLESSMSPRGRLRPRLIPTFWDMAATQVTDMPASATPDTGMPGMVGTAPTLP